MLLYICFAEKLFSDLKNLINLQKKNGIKFFQGKDNAMISAEITSYIAEAIRDDIKDILGQSSIFSIFQDASQTWKTKSEK